jgi:hypothetical protein
MSTGHLSRQRGWPIRMGRKTIQCAPRVRLDCSHEISEADIMAANADWAQPLAISAILGGEFGSFRALDALICRQTTR